MTRFPRMTLLMAATAGLALTACEKKVEPTAENNMMASDNEMGMANDMAMSNSDAPMVGGAAMLPTSTIVDNASKASNLTTLVAAVKQAGLVDTLSGPGPFTVFAPTNDAFAKVDKATLDGLMKDSAKTDLGNILKYHVVAGDMDSAMLMKAIKDGGGKATLKTVAGGTLTAMQKGNSIVLTDAKGGMSTVTQADVDQSNGVVHVIDTVLMP